MNDVGGMEFHVGHGEDEKALRTFGIVDDPRLDVARLKGSAQADFGVSHDRRQVWVGVQILRDRHAV